MLSRIRARQARKIALQVVGLLALLLVGACTDVQPIIKIGLVAPFEGLYRRTGYDALAAMRAAITDQSAPGVNVLPLALNDGADPDQAQRALQKLLVDTNVRAVVGPLWPDLAAATPAPLTTAGIPWFLPYDPFGAADAGAEPQWATGLVRVVAHAVQGQGATALVLAGSAVGWPTLSAADWSRIAGLPVRFAAAPEPVGANDAVFWLGSPADAAAYLTTLRTHQREVPFWLGPQGSDPVFAEHTKTFDRVYWVIWTDARYNAWAAAHTPSTPFAYLVYRATEAAVHAATERAVSNATAERWFVQAYVLGADGVSRPYTVP